MIRSVEFELTTKSEANMRFASQAGMWAKSARVKDQRDVVRGVLGSAFGLPPLWHVTNGKGWTVPNQIAVALTRLAPGELDTDNLSSAFKAVRDEVAAWLGADDRDQRIVWTYAQEKTAQGVYRVRIEVADATPGEDIRKILASTAEHTSGALQRVRPKKASGQGILAARASFAILPWEQTACPACEGKGWLLPCDVRGPASSTSPPCETCKGTGRKGSRLWGPIARFRTLEQPPLTIAIPVPAEHAARYGTGPLTLTRRPAAFKATGEIWLYERTERS